VKVEPIGGTGVCVTIAPLVPIILEKAFKIVAVNVYSVFGQYSLVSNGEIVF
jgi:hypothetical protein